MDYQKLVENVERNEFDTVKINDPIIGKDIDKLENDNVKLIDFYLLRI